MFVRVIEPITAPGRTVPAGLHDVTPAEFHGLSQLGRVRPATADEIEQARPAAQVETAEAQPAPATAALNHGRRRR